MRTQHAISRRSAPGTASVSVEQNTERRQGARRQRATWTWSGEVAGPCLPAKAVLEVVRFGTASTKSTETVAPETMASVTAALNSIGPSRGRAWARRAGRSACPWHLASRQRQVSVRVGAGSRAAPPLRATPDSQERATGLLLNTVEYWLVGPAPQRTGQRRGQNAPKASGGDGQRKACAGGGGANPRMHITECLLRQALTKAAEDTWQPVCGDSGPRRDDWR